MSIIVQQDTITYSSLYFCKLLYMFRVVNPPIIRSTYNCNSASGTGQTVSAVAETVWPVPDVVITVICAPDDEWIYHPKHVEQFTEVQWTVRNRILLDNYWHRYRLIMVEFHNYWSVFSLCSTIILLRSYCFLWVNMFLMLCHSDCTVVLQVCTYWSVETALDTSFLCVVSQAPLQNFEKRLLASSCLSVHMERLCCRWTDFHEIWYLSVFQKCFENIKILLKSAN